MSEDSEVSVSAALDEKKGSWLALGHAPMGAQRIPEIATRAPAHSVLSVL